MYCTIKYIEYDQFQFQELEVEDEDSSFPSFDCENNTLLINPDCPIGIIRDYIHSSLHLYGEGGDNFELCSEKAVLLNTKECEPTKSGLDVLTKMETYYIVILKSDESEPPKILIPMLNQFSKEYREFISRQTRKSVSSKASASVVRKRRLTMASKQDSLLSSKGSTNKKLTKTSKQSSLLSSKGSTMGSSNQDF